MTDSEYVEISPYEASLVRQWLCKKYAITTRVDTNLIEIEDPRYGGSYAIVHLRDGRRRWTDVYKLTKKEGFIGGFIGGKKVSRPSKALLALIEQAEGEN